MRKTWIYEVLEICDRRKQPTGTYRLVRYPQEDQGDVEGLCNHTHGSILDALECTQATRVVNNEFRERFSFSQPQQ